MRWLGFGLLAVVAAAGLAIALVGHRMLAVRALALAQGPPPLLPREPDAPGVRWLDDYFTVESLDARTWAIGEPRYLQRTVSYLIAGADRAVLLDGGPGLRDIRPVVEDLTALPVTAIPSHLHYDHVGNTARFDRIALPDLPWLRRRAEDGVLRPTDAEHLGFLEDLPVPELAVTEWWAPDAEIDLGGRVLRVVSTPGHTPESISLYDAASRQLFSGDAIYPGPLIAISPESSLGDYLRTAETLRADMPEDVVIHGGHRSDTPGAPRQGRGEVEDLARALRQVRDGELEGRGFFPRVYPVGGGMELWADLPSAQRW